jgi:hypothetical protein
MAGLWISAIMSSNVFLTSSLHLSRPVVVCLLCLLSVSKIKKVPGVPVDTNPVIQGEFGI